MTTYRLRVPRPGLAVGRHGPGARRRLAGRRGRLRRGRRRARRADQPPRLGRSGRGARPDRERPAGAARRPRSPTSRRVRERGPPLGIEARRRRSPPATRWASTRRSSRPGSISLADGLRLVRERGRLMQASGAGRDGAMAAIIGLDDARAAGARRAGVGPRHLRRREPQRPGPGRRVRRARRDRGGRRDREGARRPQGDRAAGLASPPTRR